MKADSKTMPRAKTAMWIATAFVAGMACMLAAVYIISPGIETASRSNGASAKPGVDISPEILFWMSIRGSRNPTDFEAYLVQFPNGVYAQLASNRRADLLEPRLPDPSSPVEVISLEWPRPGAVFRDYRKDGSACPECPEMVIVPAGSFRMGDLDNSRNKDEKPVRWVKIRQPFAVGRYETTFAEWDACVAAGGCNGARPGDQGWGRGRRPVIDVSWDGAQAYVSWLGRLTGRQYRLPSEAEWEYVARAGNVSIYPYGDSLRALCYYGNGPDLSTSASIAWRNTSCMDGYGEQTAPVGSFLPNPYGVHDMAGNVWEWVEDCWYDSYDGAPSDGSARTDSGNCSRRVLRGGSWDSRLEDLRSASRGRDEPDDHSAHDGFRVARALR